MPRSSFLTLISICLNWALKSSWAYAPELNREALAGIWRLTNLKSVFPEFSRQEQRPYEVEQEAFCVKEFTTYPKRVREESLSYANTKNYSAALGTWYYDHKDVLIKLCFDGSFEQYSDLDEPIEEEEEEEEEEVANEIISNENNTANTIHVRTNAIIQTIDYSKYTNYKPPVIIDDDVGELDDDAYTIKGLWDFQDGKLILAANRPPNVDPRNVHDTVLIGKVIANKEEQATTTSTSGLPNNNTLHTSSLTSDNPPHPPDYLTVPNGKVTIGKFFYPMHHPSFFEQPIYSPTKTGSFQLRQVLREAMAQQQDSSSSSQGKDYTEEAGDEFRKEQLAGKRFFVTSQPIGWEKKNKPRWSRSRKCFVVDPIPINENDKIFGLRAMEVVLFPNNTFSSISGLGPSTVLRGKWDIAGTHRNYLWMQVWRFGFGRSVSGSTFSEGPGLTKNDEKAYWGKIEEHGLDENESIQDEGSSVSSKENQKRIEIKGTIFWGWGLEPVPEGQFTMIEKLETDTDDEDDDDEEGLFDISMSDSFDNS
eukprot:CAMPEP_0172428414 /NCGR_PEP_ID=MMETSP1064-20121228/46234_1 /TAXON_ID=202472 /ORGANISM="Aulacoseira subarctica , Strain CCAP 1002/5" /LENGTH=535 /DNA_ID=CAMNT_0013173183 /DNA_START=68 /DNA_END=1673 /DNA_ORIENTATION=-